MSVAAKDCFRVTLGLHEALASQEIHDYFVVGGIAASPLEAADATFVFAEREVIAPAALSLSTHRANGTLRDIDIVVLSPDREMLHFAYEVTRKHVGKQLDISVTGFRPHETYAQRRHGLGGLVFEFLSTCTIDAAGQIRHVLGPVEYPAPLESYQAWHMSTPQGDKLRVMHPVAQVLSYHKHALAGVRPKDAAKVRRMEQNVFAVPEFKQAMEQDFAEWKIFLEALQSLRSKQTHEAYAGARQREIFLTRAKGTALHNIEKRPALVALAQSVVKYGLLDPFLGRARSA